MSIRAANNIVLVLVNDLAHLYKRFKSASTSTTSKAVVSEEHDAGLQAARRLIEGVRKNLVDQGDATDPQVVLLVVPDSVSVCVHVCVGSAKRGRAVLHGSPSETVVLLILTLRPFFFGFACRLRHVILSAGSEISRMHSCLSKGASTSCKVGRWVGLVGL